MIRPLMLGTDSTATATATTTIPTTTKERGVVRTESCPPWEDPSCLIKGMYRLLDLVTEQGNCGLGNSLLVVVCIPSRYPHS